MPKQLARLACVLFAFLLCAPPSRAEFRKATSTAGSFLPLPTWGAQAVDLDADGDVDLVRGHHAHGVKIHTNDGAGRFSSLGLDQFMTEGDRHGVLWADLDNDGVVDGVCSKGGAGGCGCIEEANEIWRGLGQGAFEYVPDDEAGVGDPFGRGRSFSAADVDGDGDLDLHHSKAPMASRPNSLYRNDGSMRFVDIADQLGLDEVLGTTGALFADYDDDGDPDLFVGGEEFNRPTALWRNDGGAFVDVTAATFVGLPRVAGADWGDYDNDGDLDLAVCQGFEGVYDSWGVEDNAFWFFVHHRLADDGIDAFHFSAPGDTIFAEFESASASEEPRIFLGPDAVRPSPAATLDDRDLLSLTDDYVGAPRFTPGQDHGLYVWRMFAGGPWVLYVSAPPGTYGNFWGTITAPGPITGAGANYLEQLSVPPRATRIFRNDGGGQFRDVTNALGFTTSENPRSVEWVDFDNDGDLDLHQTNKGTTQSGNEPDILWRNDVTSFTPLTGDDWVPGPKRFFTDGGVWADFDRDGDLDLWMQEGAPPAFLTARTPPLYYANEGPAGNWFALTVHSARNGATPVGTKVTACAGDLRVHRRVEANTWRGFQSPLTLHFGLAAHALVDSLVIVWPDGQRETIGPLPAGTALQYSQSDATGAGVGVPPAAAFAGPVYPQPSRGAQRIRLYNPLASRVLVSVYDVMGRRVRVLAQGEQPAGESHLSWDGRDQHGRSVPAGVYFIRGEGDLRFQRKAIRLR